MFLLKIPCFPKMFLVVLPRFPKMFGDVDDLIYIKNSPIKISFLSKCCVIQ